jgi:hypothetical protein
MTAEFEVSDVMKEHGVTRIASEDMTIVVVYQNRPIRSTIYRNDFNKTTKSLEKALRSHSLNNETIQAIIMIISQEWTNFAGNNIERNINKEEGCGVLRDIEELRRNKISQEEWLTKLLVKYQALFNVVNNNIPNLWPTLEFSLSIKSILNIKDCTLPFAGIILGPPSSLKTTTIELFRGWLQTYYTDNFSPRSFVSHSTAVTREQLVEIDMLPKIKNKLFLTPELAPIFSSKDDDLIQMLAIMTRILDGHGYESDTGAHGHRGYREDIMFVQIGAAVDIPHKVYKHMTTSGAKIYFYRLSRTRKKEEECYNQLNDDFGRKIREIKYSLLDYLKWFEIGPQMIHEDGNLLPKVQWDYEKDDDSAQRFLYRLAQLLSHLRGAVATSQTQDTQGSNYAYAIPTIEEPDRARIQLYNLARGHALIKGRNWITGEDISIVIKVVLSTASIERVTIFDLLIAHDGTLTTPQICTSLNITNHTAHRIMAELQALELVKLESKDELQNSEKQIVLKEEFNWFLSEEFSKLRQGFIPEDSVG